MAEKKHIGRKIWNIEIILTVGVFGLNIENFSDFDTEMLDQIILA